MKNILRITVFVLILFLLLPSTMVSADVSPVDPASASSPAKGDFRGLWVATVVNIDYPTKPTTDVEELKSQALKILDYAADTGFNAVFLQVRPASDAFYKSNYFPWSKYLTGTQGLAPDSGFDPLAFWVEEAHKRGIQLHAWLNPYRITKRVSGEPKYDLSSLDPMNPVRLHPDWVVKYSDGNLYYDPGIPEVRKLIIDGALEIIQNYNVDGIHFDDYFYPDTDFNDKATYQKYGAGFGSINDWRRSNVDTLIGDLSKAIKATGRNVRFGVSPFGIWANKKSTPLGSDTSGFESYNGHYADTRKWVKQGMVDYIAPQIYWNIGYSVADYSKLLSWWNDTVKGTGVDLYIGQAGYREGVSDPSSAWYGVSEIQKQLQLNDRYPEVKGSIFFNYAAIEENKALSALIKAVFQQRDGLAPGTGLDMARPSANISTSFSQYYISGSSDPQKPLYLNGSPVEGRSEKGYFGKLVTLSKGANTFTLSQDAAYKSFVIYRKTYSSSPEKMSSIGIPSDSTFPQSQAYRMEGEKVMLSCEAPAGSKVTVRLNGKTYAMKAASSSISGPGLYAATYTYTYTLPTYKGTPRNIDLGAPVYTMNYKGKVKTVKAPAKIGVIMKNSPFYAEVAKGVIDTYNTASSADGSAYELYEGMTDYITGKSGGFIRLASGQWVKYSDIRTITSKKTMSSVIGKAVYKVENGWDSFELGMSAPSAALASFDGALLKLQIAAGSIASTPEASALASPALPADSLLSSISYSAGKNGALYNLTLKSGQRIDGYYIEKTSGGLVLHIKRHPKTPGGTVPLAGITIMLDPGHGGNELGAVGPSLAYTEKTINLDMALKLRTQLQGLGATVLMTRTSDTSLSLTSRLAASRTAKPDMFLSIHANSMEDNVDISKYSGFSSYYREVFAKPLAQAVLDNVTGVLGRSSNGIHNNNFYVMRGTWTPSILVESGFVPNPAEFERLIDEGGQTELAKSIADAIVNYFTN